MNQRWVKGTGLVLLLLAAQTAAWAEEPSDKDLDRELEANLKALSASVSETSTSVQPSEPSASAAPETAKTSGSAVSVPAAAPAESVPAVPPQKPETLIEEVEIRGNSLVSTNTIMSKLRSQKGAPLVQETINEDVKRLYGTGYFEDIKMEVVENPGGGYRLVVAVLEKPVVRKIVIEGAKSFKDEKLRKTIKVMEGQILDRKKIKDGIEEIKKLYRDKGFRFADITSDVNVDRATNQTTLTVRINEGEKYKISSVQFEGVKSFKDRQLRKLMRTKPKNWLLLRSGVFKSNYFDEDLERIQFFYQKEGYLDVKVDPNFDYDQKNQKIGIKIVIEEGDKYISGDIKISGNRLFPESEIWQELEMLPGHAFSQYYLAQDVEKIRRYYHERGYMDARIIPDTQMNKQTNKVDVVYTIEEGDLYFVDKVVIRGNTKTKDIVIRRELRIRPGERFDGKKIDKSKQRLDNLGFFEEVTYDTEPSAAAPNKKDLVFRVKEKRTGELSFGGGVSSVDRFVGFAELSQHNFDLFNWPRFTGAGQSVSIKGRYGTINQYYNASFVEPYLFNKPISLGLDAYNSHSTAENVDFEETRLGFGPTLSRVFKDIFRVGMGYILERVELDELSSDAPLTVRNFEGANWLSRLKQFNSLDTRDNRFNPTKGWLVTLSEELIGTFLGGDQDYYVLDFSVAKYWSFFKQHTVETRLRLGTSDSVGDSDEVPVFDRFYAGGLGTVRGYNYRRVGPKEAGNAVGGETITLFNIDYNIPIPRLDAFKFVVFTDIGNVAEDSYDFFKMGDTVISVGPGIKIKTPLGPVAFYYGLPIKNRDTENRNGRFEFSLSRGF